MTTIGNIEAIEAIENRLTGFEASLRQYGIDLMASSEVEEMLARMNVEQLNEGKRSDGQNIEPAYAKSTVEIKKEKGQETDFVNLKDTEAFHRGIRFVSLRTQTRGESTDPKSDELVEKYSELIFGIDDENVQIMRDFLHPKFSVFIRSNLIKR